VSHPLEEIKTKYNAGQYEKALSLIEKTETKELLDPEILVWKGRCLQLVDHTSYELSDIENMFNQALDINPELASALLELGWFYLNVLDDAQKAIELFDRAIAVLRRQLTDAMIGKTKSLTETSNKDEALKFISGANQMALDLSALEHIEFELKSS
jgi:tetratricopeptide (TPR) repeat protein